MLSTQQRVVATLFQDVDGPVSAAMANAPGGTEQSAACARGLRVLAEDLDTECRPAVARKTEDHRRHKLVLVFHSLRHTCGTWLALAGEAPKTIQEVMRHKDITLTMDTYGHLFPGQT